MDQVLQRARSALRGSQQFRLRSNELPVEETQERQKIPDSINKNSLKYLQTRKVTSTNKSAFGSTSEFKTEINKNYNLNIARENLNVISSNKLGNEETSTSSISVTFISDANSSKKNHSRVKLSVEPKDYFDALELDANEDASASLKINSYNRKELDSEKSEKSLTISNIRSNSIQSTNTKKSATPRVTARSFTGSYQLSEKAKSKNVRAISASLIKVESLPEISEHLNSDSNSTIRTENKTLKNESESKEQQKGEEIEEENTLSYVTSLKMSVPQSEDEDEIISEKVESKVNSSASTITSISVSVSAPFTEATKSEIVPLVSKNISNIDDISERIESIIKDLSSVHESLQKSQSQTYCSTFIPELSNPNETAAVGNEKYDSDDKYDSSFISESRQQILLLPSNGKISNHSNSNISEKLSSPEKVSPNPNPRIQRKPLQLQAPIQIQNQIHTKTKPVKMKTKGNIRREKAPVQVESESEQHYMKYIPKLKHKIHPDLTHDVILNNPRDLPAFCKDLIRNVVDSNERMYNYTMEAAENMTRMYYHRKNRNKNKNNDTLQQ